MVVEMNQINGVATCISSVAILFIQKMYSQKFKCTRQKNITFKKISYIEKGPLFT